MKSVALLALALVAAIMSGCSSSSGAGNSESTGGHSGQSQTGGSANNGGSGPSGGNDGRGGSAGSMGTGGRGGSDGSGGATTAVGSGGTAGNGGMVGRATGGSSSAGGSPASGGTPTGGATLQGSGGGGGVNNSAGAPGSGGGGPTTGGAGGKAGGTGAGGTGDAGAGGAGAGGAGAGGSTAGGGSTSTAAASGYPAAGASGQAKPAGAASKVTVLDWAGFKSAISFTFDDTNQTQIDHYKELQALNDKGNNVRYTFFLWTGKNEISSSVWPQAQKDGHELGNHTKSHQSAASAADIDAAESTIKSMFSSTAYSIAAPNGDSSYQSAAKGKFLTNRTAGDSGGVAPTDNPSTRQFALPCIIPATGASATAMQSSLNPAVTSGKWEIFLVHGFTGGSDGAYQPVDINQFTSVVSWAKNQGNVWIDTVGTISAYWVAEYNFNKLTPTTNGSDKTWTWKTTDFSNPFPTGKYLRVKTDGGTLKQGNTTLTWDDHGYYEVALDAGTLTLSP